jgi:hypothetical protein
MIGCICTEDFTGQYGSFGSYRNVPWYIEQKTEAEDWLLVGSFEEMALKK